MIRAPWTGGRAVVPLNANPSVESTAKGAKRTKDATRRRVLVAVVWAVCIAEGAAADWGSVAVGGGGFVTGLACSGTGGDLYMRTDVGGAYRWDAGNTQWRPITDTLPGDASNEGHLYGIGSIAVDPANANRVFIACGKYNWSTPSGVYVCGDTSATAPAWTCIDPGVRVLGNGGSRQAGERLAVDPYNANVVYFGSYNVSGGGTGLKKYTFDGAWHVGSLTTPAAGDTDLGIIFVAADKTGGSISDGARAVSRYLYIGVYSATAGHGGVYVSSDGGGSWTKATGVTVDKPARGEVGGDGSLYVTSNGAVAKLARGATVLTAISPVASLNYCALAVDPSVAGTVMVAEYVGSNRIWRSVDGGGTWALMTRSIHATEPDGITWSKTGNGNLDHIADLMINPENLDEVLVSDFFGVQRTQGIKDDTSAADWYMLQKNHEEIVPLQLRSAPGGAPLLSAVADVQGFVHATPSARPTARFNNPSYISSSSLDFSEATTGSNTVWARVGNILWYSGNDTDDRVGGVSIDDGGTWACFGQLACRTLYNSATAGWEEFDVGPYLRRQKELGVNVVTIILRASEWQSPSEMLKFSSKEGGNPPQLLIDGATTLTTTADAFCYLGAVASNYGGSTELRAKNYYNQTNNVYWSYLKFDLSSVSSVESAKLRMYRLAATATGYQNKTYIMSTPTTTWTEGAITAANRPTDLYAPPGGVAGGRIALSATDSRRMVWVGEDGTVWWSKNRGVTWGRGTLGGANLTVDSMSLFEPKKDCLASDRVARDTFYLYKKVNSGTVYRSTDGGVTWSVLVTSVGTADGYKIKTLPGVAGRFWFVAQNWNVQAYFRYWNGTSVATVPGIANTVDFAFGKPAPGRSNPSVYVRKKDFTYWYSTDATAGTTFTWTQADVSTLNANPNIMEGDRQTFGRLYVGTGGRGIFYADVMPDAPPDQSDFVVLPEIVFSPDPPAPGGLFNATVSVRNVGEAAGDAGTLAIWTDYTNNAPRSAQLALGVIESNATASVTFSNLVAAAGVGAVTFRAMADADGATAESDEANNDTTRDYTPRSADVVTWTGLGSGTNWNEAANWDVRIPGSTDTAVLGSAITGTKTITLGANQTVSNLVIATTATLTIGNTGDVASGYALTLTNVDRQDVAGTENLHAFAASVNLASDANTNSTWTLNGSDVLRMNAVLGATAAVTFVKQGTGTFNLNFTSPAYAGPWSIVEGAVTASGSNSMTGNATVGGTAVAASLAQSNKNALYNNMNLTVLTNGTFTAGDIDNGRVNSIHAKEGGVATVGTYFYSLHAYLTGGTIHGGTFFNGGYTQDIRSYASALPALFDCAFKFSLYDDATINVENGAAPIDLLVTKSLYEGGSSKSLTKSGAGVLRITSSGALSVGTFKVTGGTVLVDNASGSATGKSAVTVNNGTTLGGTGILGGVATYTAANVTVASTSGGSLAVLAPGTLDGATGDPIIGTLTVGGAAQTNNVTLGNNSRMQARVGAAGTADRLTVYGVLNLSSASDGLVLSVDPDAKGGTYVLASATGGITGTFNAVIGKPSAATLDYTATTVELTLVSKGSVVTVR